MNDLFSLKNKIALISDSYSFLGEILVYVLAKSGAVVYAHGDDNYVQNIINKYPDFDIRKAEFDLIDKDSVKAFIDNYEFDTLDILVNSSCEDIYDRTKTPQTSHFIENSTSLVTASQTLIENFLPFLEQSAKNGKYPSVINIVSISGAIISEMMIQQDEENFNMPFHESSRAAIIHWSKYAAAEFGTRGIRFNTISPNTFINPDQVSKKTFISQLEQKIPVGRIGDLKDIIGPLIFLASESSKYITGENIILDGGMTV